MKYTVTVTKGPNEPWWKDEESSDKILYVKEYDTLEEAKCCYREFYNILGQHFESIKEQNEFQSAFFNFGEMICCYECADDVQLYYGLEMISK